MVHSWMHHACLESVWMLRGMAHMATAMCLTCATLCARQQLHNLYLCCVALFTWQQLHVHMTVNSCNLIQDIIQKTQSTNTYHWEYPPTVCGSPGHATITENLLINVCLSATCDLHVTSKIIITSQLTPCLHWFSIVANENRLQTRVRCMGGSCATNHYQQLSHSGFLCVSELPYQLRWPMVLPNNSLCDIVLDSRQSPYLL